MGEASQHRLAWLLGSAAFVFALALAPPETRPWSAPGCAALLVLLLALACGRLESGLLVLLAALPAAGWMLYRFATAPGAAVEPLAHWSLAVGAGAIGCAAGRARLSPGVLARSLSIAGALVAVQALFQLAFGLEAAARALEPISVPGREAVLARLAEGRAFGPFATPAGFGGYLSLAVPATVFLVARSRGAARGAWALALALQAGGFLAARSWGAAAALLGALLIARDLSRRMRAVSLACGAAAVVAVAALRPALLDLERPDHPLRLRWGNARIAAAMIAEHPWKGVGPGGYAEHVPRYRRPGDNETRHAHDLPLELCAELGVPLGTLAASVFVALFLGPALRRGVSAGARPLGVGLAAFALHNLADFTAFFPSLMWTAAFARGWLARAPAPAHRVPAAWLRLPALAAVGAAATVFALGSWAGQARYEAGGALEEGRPQVALAAAGRAAALAPWHPDGWLLLAQARARTAATEADWRQAERDADLAVDASPVRPGARAVRARIRWHLGDRGGALADMDRAARLYPAREAYGRERERLRRSALLRPPEAGEP